MIVINAIAANDWKREVDMSEAIAAIPHTSVALPPAASFSRVIRKQSNEIEISDQCREVARKHEPEAQKIALHSPLSEA